MDAKEKPAALGGTPVRSTPLYYGHQYIDEDDIAQVTRVLRGDFLTCGPDIDRLEEKLCRLTGARHAVVCSNGTAALHIACLAAGVGDGDEVITTPITFAASANCALFCGASPVFADIDPETFNISPAEVESHITEATKAVVAVDFTGQAAELDRLQKICEDRGIVLIEDAAHSIGTSYRGKMVGSIADMTTFSFHPVKTVTGGEGGAVLTDSDEYHQKLLYFRAHGITRNPELMEHAPDGPWYYEQIALSTNYRMTDIQAALISSQLDKLDKFAGRRREIVDRYNEAFSDMPELIVQREIPESDTVRHLYVLGIDEVKAGIDRAELFRLLGEENIHCNVHYIPVYYFPYYEKLGYKRGICPNAEAYYERSLTLPLYYSMTDQDVEDVISAVKKIINYYKKKSAE